MVVVQALRVVVVTTWNGIARIVRTVLASPYCDAPLWAFYGLMAFAATITAHGTWVFYQYMLDPWLATAITVVITGGIPTFETAFVLDTHTGRAGWGWKTFYVVCGGVLLAMEAWAQYMQAQAVFTPRVLAAFPNSQGVDLATFAQQPAGRILPIIYLALPSILVVGLGFAGGARLKVIRSRIDAGVAKQASDAKLAADLLAMTERAAKAERAAQDATAALNQARSWGAGVQQDLLAVQTLRTELAKAQAELAAMITAQAQAVPGDAPQIARVLAQGKRLSQREIATLLGVSKTSVTRWIDTQPQAGSTPASSA